ncbi:MAG: hypothetical protein LBB83_11030 [Treponema sp.]|jgi:hypothetical protein|nr:hypothetical protein [Treponema sp.]
MTEDTESAKLLAYFQLLSEDHKQEIIKRAENLVSVQKTPEKAKKKTKNHAGIYREGSKGRQILP